MVEAVVVALTFGAITLLVVGLTTKSERQMLRERMALRAQTGNIGISSVELELNKSLKQRVALPFLRKLASIVDGFTPAGALRLLDEKLETAGRPGGLGAREFMGVRVLSLIALTALALAIPRVLPDLQPMVKLGVTAFLILVGALGPNYMVNSAISSRQTQIRRVLADTLDLLVVSVEAGLGFDQAMQRVVEKFDNPLSREMERALQEVQLGKLRSESLRDLAKRVNVPELTSFVAAICQADQLGVSIAKVLRVQSDSIRTARSQKIREAAGKLPVKMLIPMVFFIFPSIFVVLGAPAGIGIARAFGMIP
jgi:tight adherence protein C